MQEEIKPIQSAESQIISQILQEIKEYESGSINLSDTVTFSQKEMVNIIKTHQNKGFLKTLPEGMVDDRMFFDIVTPLVDTGVKNTDIDTKNVEPVSLLKGYVPQAFLIKPELNLYFKYTDEDTRLNNHVEAFTDEGNVVSRKVKDGVYRKVLLENLYVIDQTAECLEDTTVIERDFMNQSQLRKMAEWKQDKIQALIDSFKKSESSTKTPYFELFYRYGDISTDQLNDINGKDEEINSNKYVPGYVVFGRAKITNKDDETTLSGERGFVLFADELKPEEIKISRDYIIKKYKPYEEAHFGPYKGRWLREGYRELCIQNQNRANELGNQIRIGMKLSLKHILWSTDDNIKGKNILSALQDGQIIKAADLQVLNLSENKNLAAYAEEWNRNIQNAREKCRAFEMALNENSPSSTTATEANINNINNSKYFKFKQQKLGIFFRNIYNRWVLPELLKNISAEHELEITGDPSYMDMYYDALTNCWYVKNLYQIGPHTPEQAEAIKQMKKEELMKGGKQFLTIKKDYYANAQIVLDFTITDESSNKQTKVTNGLSLLKYIDDPASRQDIVIEIANDLGFRIKKAKPQPMAVSGQQEKQPGQPAGIPQETVSNNQTI
jgi:hypothetical protein